MPEIHDLNPTDASNTARFPESQAPSTLNDGARALEGLIARYESDQDHSVVATLSGSTVQMTANRASLTLTGTTSNYIADLVMAFTMGANPITGPVAVNINGIGRISLRDNTGASLTSSALVASARALIVKDGANDYFRLLWPQPIPDNSITGAKIALGSDAQGDVMYYNGTDWARLGAGTSGQFLQTLGAGANPQWADASGAIGQAVNVQDGIVATGTTAIPHDDTTPQNTEGDEFMTLAITPQNASSTLLIDVVVNGATSGTSGNSPFTVALFQDTTAGALASGHAGSGDANIPQNVKFTHKMTAGTTSATTFKVRAGGPNGTFTFNGASGAQRFNGTMASSITITEVLP